MVATKTGIMMEVMNIMTNTTTMMEEIMTGQAQDLEEAQDMEEVGLGQDMEEDKVVIVMADLMILTKITIDTTTIKVLALEEVDSMVTALISIKMIEGE